MCCSLVPRVFHVLVGPWGMPSSLMDHIQLRTRSTWPESYGTLVSAFLCLWAGLNQYVWWSICVHTKCSVLSPVLTDLLGFKTSKTWHKRYKVGQMVAHAHSCKMVNTRYIQMHAKIMWTSGHKYKYMLFNIIALRCTQTQTPRQEVYPGNGRQEVVRMSEEKADAELMNNQWILIEWR